MMDAFCMFVGYVFVALASVVSLMALACLAFNLWWNHLKYQPGFVELFMIYHREGRKVAKAEAAEVIAKAKGEK